MAGIDITIQVKQVVSEIEPKADVILYGSRARGTSEGDSDWDFLILTATCPNRELKQEIRRRLYEIEWATGEVISSVIHGKDEWNRPVFSLSPFHANVDHEGIRL